MSGATHAGERGPRDPNEAAADCESIAPVTMLVPARLCLRRLFRRLPPRTMPDSGISIRCTSLRFAATPDLDGNEDTRPRVCRFRSIPFRSLKPAETGHEQVSVLTIDPRNGS